MPMKQLKRFKLFLVFYEIHDVEKEIFEQNDVLTLEYKVLNYSQKIKLKGMTYDEANSNNF